MNNKETQNASDMTKSITSFTRNNSATDTKAEINANKSITGRTLFDTLVIFFKTNNIFFTSFKIGNPFYDQMDLNVLLIISRLTTYQEHL